MRMSRRWLRSAFHWDKTEFVTPKVCGFEIRNANGILADWAGGVFSVFSICGQDRGEFVRQCLGLERGWLLRTQTGDRREQSFGNKLLAGWLQDLLAIGFGDIKRIHGGALFSKDLGEPNIQMQSEENFRNFMQ